MHLRLNAISAMKNQAAPRQFITYCIYDINISYILYKYIFNKKCSHLAPTISNFFLLAMLTLLGTMMLPFKPYLVELLELRTW